MQSALGVILEPRGDRNEGSCLQRENLTWMLTVEWTLLKLSKPQVMVLNPLLFTFAASNRNDFFHEIPCGFCQLNSTQSTLIKPINVL